ncbi:hypothetical protein MKK67_08935 [Methylobacterium sp. J-072]|uniref:hypothetical protein n=1 Tax=Methylobacterium sp. J-072 TaxID=2836651 RepID=UPI001FB9EF2A|nr:hypothetical protein [Methylobacterium sp. J-072]MCJ2092624.1 hypothetical protein [Methylobacterium sp. J-072]
MDMPTPKGLDTEPDTNNDATLARLARTLGCKPDRFFDVARTGKEKDTSELIHVWLAIRSPEGRDAVFAFAREVLHSETKAAHRNFRK